MPSIEDGPLFEALFTVLHCEAHRASRKLFLGIACSPTPSSNGRDPEGLLQ